MIEIEKLKDYEYLLSHFYTVDSSTTVTEEDLDAEKFLKKDMKLSKEQKRLLKEFDAAMK